MLSGERAGAEGGRWLLTALRPDGLATGLGSVDCLFLKTHPCPRVTKALLHLWLFGRLLQSQAARSRGDRLWNREGLGCFWWGVCLPEPTRETPLRSSQASHRSWPRSHFFSFENLLLGEAKGKSFIFKPSKSQLLYIFSTCC